MKTESETMVPENVFIFVRGHFCLCKDMQTNQVSWRDNCHCFSHLFVEGESVKPHLAPELDLQLVSIVELDGAVGVLLDKESTELGEEDRVAHALQVVDVNVGHPNMIHHVETEYSEYDCKKNQTK